MNSYSLPTGLSTKVPCSVLDCTPTNHTIFFIKCEDGTTEVGLFKLIRVLVNEE